MTVFNEAKLLKMQAHGTEIFKLKDEQGMTMLHLAVRGETEQARKVINFASVNGGPGTLDQQNRNGETALHLCCGKTPNFDLAKYLVLKGASS